MNIHHQSWFLRWILNRTWSKPLSSPQYLRSGNFVIYQNNLAQRFRTKHKPTILFSQPGRRRSPLSVVRLRRLQSNEKRRTKNGGNSRPWRIRIWGWRRRGRDSEIWIRIVQGRHAPTPQGPDPLHGVEAVHPRCRPRPRHPRADGQANGMQTSGLLNYHYNHHHYTVLGTSVRRGKWIQVFFLDDISITFLYVSSSDLFWK